METNPVLVKLGLDKQHWRTVIQCFESTFSIATGTVESIDKYRIHIKRKRKSSQQIVA